MCATMVGMDELQQAAREHHDAKATFETARTRLAEAIVTAARSGVRQTDIVRATGYTRERVRQLCRDAGITPAT